MESNLEFIKAIPEDDFSLSVWIETCEYLTGNTSAKTVKEAKEILIRSIEV